MERSIPNELLIELWSRISLTKLPTMRLVSKNWKDLIDSSANFIASKQPRIFCTYLTYDGERRIRSVPQNHVYPNDGRWECFRFPRYRPEVFSQPVNGLIGVRAQGITNECLIQINNFFTGKSLYLPSLPQKFYYGDTSFFLGCLTSPLLFKVLCVRVEKTPDEVLVMPQICSVKGKSLSWREISCKDPHFPINSKPGMCKDGVIYYAAWNVNSELFVMSFNLETEVFSPIYLGVITRNDFMSIRMMDYNGDVSLVISQPTPRGTNDVSQDIHVKMQQGWRSTQFKIRRYSPLQECPLFFNGNSELVLAPTEIDYPLKWRQQKLKFEKAELGYRLWFYKNGEDFRSQYYDEFTDRLTDRGRVDVEFFVGTASFIIPKELLE